MDNIKSGSWISVPINFKNDSLQVPEYLTKCRYLMFLHGIVGNVNIEEVANDKYNLATYGKDVAESSKAIISRLHTDPVLETLASYQTRVMDENREFNPTKISELFEQLQNGKEKVVQEFERTYNVSVVTPNTISKENTQEVNDNNL
ncbi:MAG: hypothetical protein K5752_07155 [Succinivibrionaceae bacterium]|nr:hypothetical protein [Succinivibrionaceae bacterium]